MLSRGDRIVYDNINSKFDGLCGTVITVHPECNKINLRLERPFTSFSGEYYNEIIYICTDYNNAKILESVNDGAEESILKTIKTLTYNYFSMSEEDRVRLSEKYMKMIQNLTE